MKKLMKLATFGILMGGLMSNTAFAGLVISDAKAPSRCEITEVELGGLVISDFIGLVISDITASTCSDTTSSATGLVISD